jgi:hypothetical protein
MVGYPDSNYQVALRGKVCVLRSLCEVKTSVFYLFGQMESNHTLNLDLAFQE